jgi:RNA polymerase sigma factor (sigma-70 family)
MTLANMPVSDQELVANVLDGDHEAFRYLIEKHQKLVWHLVYRMVQDTEDSHELSQEVFLKVYHKLDTFRFDSKLSTWVGRIAFNMAVRHLQKKNIPLVEQDNDEIVASIPDTADFVTEFLDQQIHTKLHEVIESLAPLPRTLLTLYYLDELSIDEVAQIVEKPAGTVKNALFRARALLKTKLRLRLG